ncbi:MAG: thymidylate kinase [Candidatus Moranbacteria bacterium]|nr:thymidylate kinase [Candidatus Moranbacteria bacterium]
MKGIFIVIDGIDGSGKKTQTENLVKKLQAQNRKVKTIDFPQYYDNFFGKTVSRYLSGELGTSKQVNPFIASVLYAADRFESSEKIREWLEKGFVVISDRYTSSNQIHQGGKIKDPQKRTAFLKWLDEMEFGVFKIPKPDLIVYLNMPCGFSEKLLTNTDAKDRKKYSENQTDIHESDPEHLQNARKSALKLVREKNNWVNVECVENDKLLSIENIANKIWNKIKPFLDDN